MRILTYNQAWRILTRSFMSATESKNLVAYTPMFHARLLAETEKYFDSNFQPIKVTDSGASTPYLDGNPLLDRPLFVQFCANDPEILLAAAKKVAPYCDAVDLNLGCPQGIARKGHYGAFLQEDWDLISRLISKLHEELSIPVTAKIRIQETKAKTLDYAKMILAAGASILTVHGRRREQKGHNTGVADWTVLRYLRDNLPPETVIFANGNILQHADIQRCMAATGADGVMSAEGNLHDPSIFATPPTDPESREYWRGPNGIGGYRMDAIIRRYLDIIYKHILVQEPPVRTPLFVVGDKYEPPTVLETKPEPEKDQDEGPAKKKRRKNKGKSAEAATAQNLLSMQAHLFSVLRPLITVRTDIRDQLAQTRAGDMTGFEKVLSMVEQATREELIKEAEANKSANRIELVGKKVMDADENKDSIVSGTINTTGASTSAGDDARTRCKRPWYICQTFLRPLPEEAYAKGSLQLSKKKKQELAAQHEAQQVLVNQDEVIKQAVAG
jgi:tRNA-dihydrouridine synthase 1